MNIDAQSDQQTTLILLRINKYISVQIGKRYGRKKKHTHNTQSIIRRTQRGCCQCSIVNKDILWFYYIYGVCIRNVSKNKLTNVSWRGKSLILKIEICCHFTVTRHLKLNNVTVESSLFCCYIKVICAQYWWIVE